MISRRSAPFLLLLLASCAVTADRPERSPATAASDGGDWVAYGRTALGDRHSPLKEIQPDNVSRLTIAWRYHTGEVGPGYESRRPPRLSATPIAIGGTLYLLTPFGSVVALDGATGREIWRFEARVSGKAGFGDFVSRGVSYWRDPRASAGAHCSARIFAGVVDARLIALDALDGRRCAGFGDDGTVDLRRGLRNPPDNEAEYEVTSPPAIVGDTIVVGSAVADNNRLSAASGEVRAYDARSGRLLWTWDPVPQEPGDPAFESWHGPAAHRTGGANTWSVIAADPGRDLVFLPTSSPSVDYWGGARLGNNLYANSIVALRASTGERVWSFQTVHHDLWDYDNAAPPALVDVTIAGRRVAAVIEATKSGQLFVLNRNTGEPLFSVEERRVPASDAAGETAAPSQPFSSLPALSPTSLTAADFDTLPETLRGACRAQFERLRHDGAFTPPSERGSLTMPSNIGGAHWGGVAFDPANDTVVVPVNRIASVVTLIPRGEIDAERAQGIGGERLGLEYARMAGSPYVLRREFFAAGGRLCSPQPYGSLVAVSLRSRRIVWQVPLGTAEGTPLAAAGPARGMINLGGPITTESGLIFIAAVPDAYLRAFDLANGRELWRGRLPAGARATPMTYAAAGRQFVSVAAGGDGEIFGRSDEIVAFALPKSPADPEIANDNLSHVVARCGRTKLKGRSRAGEGPSSRFRPPCLPLIFRGSARTASRFGR